jgi:phage gp36-like protein
VGYCTEEDLKKVLPKSSLMQLVDDDRTGDSTEPSVRIVEAISQADGEIDSYLEGLGILPLTGTVPAIIRQCSCSLAIYNLYSRHNETIPETREMRHKDAVRILRDIRDKKTMLPSESVPATSPSGFSMGVVVHEGDDA